MRAAKPAAAGDGFMRAARTVAASDAARVAGTPGVAGAAAAGRLMRAGVDSYFLVVKRPDPYATMKVGTYSSLLRPDPYVTHHLYIRVCVCYAGHVDIAHDEPGANIKQPNPGMAYL